jgi:hypothetical protein
MPITTALILYITVGDMLKNPAASEPKGVIAVNIIRNKIICDLGNFDFIRYVVISIAIGIL